MATAPQPAGPIERAAEASISLGHRIAQLATVAMTASMRLDYVGPTPLHAPLEFRARMFEHRGRRITISCTGSSGADAFVEALGTFVEVDLAHILSEFDQLVSAADDDAES